MTEWEKFYRNGPSTTFEDNEVFYRFALKAVKPAFLRRHHESKPISAVFAGFYPKSPSPQRFERFMDENFPDRRHSTLFVDKNEKPLKYLPKRKFPKRAQEDIEHLALDHGPVDLVVLDGVINYMSDDQLNNLAVNSLLLLSRHGLLMASLDVPLYLPASERQEVEREYERRGVPYYFRDKNRLGHLLRPLDYVSFTGVRRWGVATFAQPLSGYIPKF